MTGTQPLSLHGLIKHFDLRTLSVNDVIESFESVVLLVIALFSVKSTLGEHHVDFVVVEAPLDSRRPLSAHSLRHFVLVMRFLSRRALSEVVFRLLLPLFTVGGFRR